MIDFNRDIQGHKPEGNYEDEYAGVTPLEWFNYQLATAAYDWQMDPRLVKTLEAMANILYIETYNMGFERGDYFEGWEEGYKAGKSSP